MSTGSMSQSSGINPSTSTHTVQISRRVGLVVVLIACLLCIDWPRSIETRLKMARGSGSLCNFYSPLIFATSGTLTHPCGAVYLHMRVTWSIDLARSTHSAYVH